MGIFVIGISHKTASVEVRERLAVSSEDLPAALASLGAESALEEAVVLSTCNRTEVYAGSADGPGGEAAVRKWLSRRAGADLGECLYRRSGPDALAHLLRVASSLDSMVLGEAQILGQVKAAFATARRTGTAGPCLHAAFAQAFRIAKRVRRETEVGANAVSVACVAVQLATRSVQVGPGCSALLVGAGKMSDLAAAHLRAKGIHDFHVANRSKERGERLANELSGRFWELEDVPRLLSTVDLVITCTASPGLLVSYDDMASAMHHRRGRPMFLVDLSVPRDIDPRVAEIAGVTAYDVDDIERVVDENRDQRAAEALIAERIIQEELAAMAKEERALDVMAALGRLRRRAADTAGDEAARTIARLDAMGAPPEAHETVRAMARAIVNKLLHEPTRTIRLAADQEEGARLSAALVSLFDLEEGVPDREVSTEHDLDESAWDGDEDAPDALAVGGRGRR